MQVGLSEESAKFATLDSLEVIHAEGEIATLDSSDVLHEEREIDLDKVCMTILFGPCLSISVTNKLSAYLHIELLFLIKCR
jgi:hypothetical protein